MKRFYKVVTVEPAGGRFEIRLDGRPIRTPLKAPLASESRSLADAIAAEWDAQKDEVKPQSMPFTQLLNTAIDRIRGQREQIVNGVSGYAETDLVCYRADRPAELARRQAELWQPLLDWAVTRYDAPLRTTAGIMPSVQPREAIRALHSAVEALDDTALTALQAATAACGSLVVALALIEGRIDADAAYHASQLDELYQAEQWGEDEAAAERRAALKEEIAVARRFLDLART
jgi:chaperone required for assembly of F1-ATPase